jgi:hypothetical protein
VTPPKPTRRTLKWSLRGAIALKLRGHSYDDLAARFDLPRSTIHERLKGVFDLLDPERLEAYEANRAQVLSAVELDMLNLLADPERQAKASLNNVGYVYTQIQQSRRLEQGLSTTNLALHELVERVERERSHARRSAKADELPSAPRQTTEAGER